MKLEGTERAEYIRIIYSGSCIGVETTIYLEHRMNPMALETITGFLSCRASFGTHTPKKEPYKRLDVIGGSSLSKYLI